MMNLTFSGSGQVTKEQGSILFLLLNNNCNLSKKRCAVEKLIGFFNVFLFRLFGGRGGGGGKKISMFGGPDRARWRTELSSVENTAQFSK